MYPSTLVLTFFHSGNLLSPTTLRQVFFYDSHPFREPAAGLRTFGSLKATNGYQDYYLFFR